MEDLYYIQDSRSYVGNDVLWWALKGNGYTTNLDLAQTYTREEAIRKNQNRHTDIPWPKEYIDARWRKAVDIQYIHRNEAKDISGITLVEPPKMKREVVNCVGCGRILSEAQIWGSGCPNCGQDNRP